MQNDPLFHDFFRDLPGCFFQLIKRPETEAILYEMASIEYKAASVRLDGVFRPKRGSIGTTYLWEAQFYRDETFYANFLIKAGFFLKNENPAQEWIAVAIYPSRSIEQKNLSPYRCLLESNQFIPIYLDELPPAEPDQFEMGVLELIASKPDMALEKAKALLPRVRTSKRPEKLRRNLLEFIETVILYQFPKMSRPEVEKMLQVTDIRQTRVFQEALEEGRDEKAEAIVKHMLSQNTPLAEIAKLTGMTLAEVRKLSRKTRK